MAGSVNKVILIGNLGADPDLRYTSSGKAVCDLRIATSESFGRGDDRKEKTEWHRVVVWDKTAENCAEYLQKGRKVYVEGRLQTREWEDKDGGKRWTTEIVARDVQFLGGKSDGDKNGQTSFKRKSGGDGGNSTGNGGGGFEDDDIPF